MLDMGMRLAIIVMVPPTPKAPGAMAPVLVASPRPCLIIAQQLKEYDKEIACCKSRLLGGAARVQQRYPVLVKGKRRRHCPGGQK